ncbi:hypothetical protein HOU03_gp067 [Caulobacter phage CcrSC]|uniref:Uncharacterized protein n=1 Tax=Caulobacter phage CcrSC TaxID=2283272 RepID=A0A385EFZ7_9CAUD|nr:hypothetical protein HOU03_gp067 [Caulobacter phage CcrSC]AXQ69649.1 hypothetical protein CcrSC_gp067c [Caulobacter phage CcrSC]
MNRDITLAVLVGGTYLRSFDIDAEEAAAIRKGETINLPREPSLKITRVERTFGYRNDVGCGPLRLSSVEIDTVSL